MIQKPMLAELVDFAHLRYPCVASPKLDGIRCLVREGTAVTRKLLPIPNTFIRNWVEANVPEGFDGELMSADPTAPFKAVTSQVMSRDGEPDFRYHVFDYLKDNPEKPYRERYAELYEAFDSYDLNRRCVLVAQTLMHNFDDLMGLHDYYLGLKLEGTMVRCPESPYKFGRSTKKQAWMCKLKQFQDEEATVTGIQQLQKNANKLTRDELGYAKRSHKKSGKIPLELMGSLDCVFDDGTEFNCGVGFTLKDRERFYDYDAIVDHRIKVKHQPPTRAGREEGVKPRFPVFMGLRLD